ncbi:MAG TPA: hypothetical protein VF407_12655 [Polyangiaceae bacterium]
MVAKKTVDKAVKLVEKAGFLLVFPIENREEPPSLWHALYPGEKMVWEWDDDGDGRVHDLWHLRAALATSLEVVYVKWFRGRATLLSKDLFRAMLSRLEEKAGGNLQRGISHEAKAILELLEETSPQSTKSIRAQMELGGKPGERVFTKALQELWERFLIVGAGEVDDGAFPSLAIGATHTLFEDLRVMRNERNPKGTVRLGELLDRDPNFKRAFAKSEKHFAR